MSRKTVKFELAHRDFKTVQLSAFNAYEIAFASEECEPEELLKDTYVKVGSDWARLDSNEEISRQIFHPECLEAPLTTLVRLMDKVKEISCGCIYRWESVNVP